MKLVTQESAGSDAAAQKVVDELAGLVGVSKGVAELYGHPPIPDQVLAHRHRLAAAQLRIERSLMAQNGVKLSTEQTRGQER